MEGERLEGELAALKAQLDTLDREGVEGGRRGSESEGDEVLYVQSQSVCSRRAFTDICDSRLKLQVYRSLGIDVSQDPNTGVFNRAVIRNPAKGDVNVVNVDAKVDRKVYADMFWDSL